jgi:cytochrome b subunit of formate dehydrogenase
MPDFEEMPPPVYQHLWFVRFCHWANAVTLTVMVMSGLQIFMAFPSFGSKIPQRNVVDSIPEVYRLGDWLGGGLQSHFTFMWLFAGGGVLYAVAQIVSGHFRTVLFRPRDIGGVGDGSPSISCVAQTVIDRSIQSASEARLHRARSPSA